MNGTSSALTTKPARSWQSIAFLASEPSTQARERAVVSSEVSSDGTSSTSWSTGTGLKKWMPMTCCGRLVTTPSFMIGIEEVLDARIASGEVTISSRARKSSTLAASFSTIASTTTSRSAMAPRSVSTRTRASTASAVVPPAPSSLPFASARCSDFSSRGRGPPWPPRRTTRRPRRRGRLAPRPRRCRRPSGRLRPLLRCARVSLCRTTVGQRTLPASSWRAMTTRCTWLVPS